MLTDSPPRRANLAGFQESDGRRTLELPHDGCLLAIAKCLEEEMRAGATPVVRRECARFLTVASRFYEVPECSIRVLAARRLRVRENWTSELFGDYVLGQ